MKAARSFNSGEQFPQIDQEEERWLKRTVSLPALTKDPRPLMWLRAEGPEESSDDGLLGFDFRTPARPSSQAYAISRRRSYGDAEDALSGGATLDSVAKGSVLIDKRKRMKKIDLFARESAHVDKHRQLKVMLREQRQNARSLSCSRHLVGHLERSKDGSVRCRKMIDQQKMEKSVSRIAGHIHGCSHARHELQEMQKKMAFAVSPGPSTALGCDLKGAFADALRRPHTPDNFD